jgi:Fe2+ or Zn2+ uptake regulation protein
MEKSSSTTIRALLRGKGMKATPARCALLELLERSERPLATFEIVDALQTQTNQATVYRAIEQLKTARLLRRVEMGHAHAHYERHSEDSHHHHLICRSCNKTVHLNECTLTEHTEKDRLKKTGFRTIDGHSLEFYGTCDDCAKKDPQRARSPKKQQTS